MYIFVHFEDSFINNDPTYSKRKSKTTNTYESDTKLRWNFLAK